MSYVSSEAVTNTFTEARAREVLGKTFDDFLAMYYRGLISSKERCESFIDDLTYLLNKQAIDRFQIKFIKPNGTKSALEYEVSDDGTLFEDSPSGGIDYYQYPKDTHVSLWVNYRPNTSERVFSEMRKRGWGAGSPIVGTREYDRSYSKNGYGLKRYTIEE